MNKKIEKYIKTKAPWYTVLLEYSRKELNKIKEEIVQDEDRLDLELHMIKWRLEREIQKETNELIARMRSER